jgi:signal transduction histidine kinase
VELSIEKQPDYICMKIKDDGKSFDMKRVMLARGNKRLGLLGMRERLEMVGGSVAVESAPGKGTTIIAQIPPGNAARGEG